MAKGDAIYFPDVQSDIDMKNTYKLLNYPGSTNILSQADTIYVDPINGTSGGQRGTTAAFKTLAQAVAVVQAGDKIQILGSLSDSGFVTISVACSIDGNSHAITASSTSDTKKIVVSADGVTIKNIEFNGVGTGGTDNGSVITVNNKRCTLDNVYIHDSSSTGISVNNDFSGTSLRRITIDNVAGSGIYFNSQNVTVTGCDIGVITLTRIGQKGLAIARGGAETNQVFGVNVRDVYYDTGVGNNQEAMYIHGLTDFHISNVTGYNNEFNISLDTCDHGTLENAVIRGGITAQYCGLELAWCKNIAVSNCVFDGKARDGTNLSTTTYGIVASTASPQTTAAGPYSFTNVISLNFTAGLNMTKVYGVDITGGSYNGTFCGLQFSGCGKVAITGALVEATGSDGNDVPINIDSGSGGNDTAYSSVGLGKNYSIQSCLLKASAGCNAEISITSQDATDTINGVLIKNNRKVDAQAISPAVKQTLGGGGVISNVIITGNELAASWNNDALNLGIITSQLNTLGGGADANWNQIELANAALGSAIMFQTASGGTHQPLIAGADDALRFYGTGQAEKMRLQNGLGVGTTTDPGNGCAILNGSLRLGNTAATHTSGTGTPEGAVSAPVGSTFTRTDGGVGTTFYVKETGAGNTGWTAGVSTVGGGATIASTTQVLVGDNTGNAIAAVAGETGTGKTVRADGPTFTVPVLGVASATSVNKWTLTAPSTAATLTAGADGLTYTLPEITTKIGFRHIPQNSQSVAYTTVLNDSGKHIYHPASDANNRIFTIDSNANVAYPIGTAVMFVNMSANNLSIAITADTMYLAGVGTTGTRTLAQYGKATAVKTGTTEWVIAGVGLS